MNQLSTFELKDIEKFLQINSQMDNQKYSPSLKKLLNVKEKINIFKNIDLEDLKAIVYDVNFVKVKSKEYVIKEGQEHNEIYFIINGECQVFRNSISLATLKPGEIFGTSGAIFSKKRRTSVICSSNEATLLSFCIDENNMEFCSEALAILYKNLATDINHKLDELDYAYIKK